MLANLVDTACPVTVPVMPSQLAVKEFAGFRMLTLTQQQRCDDNDYAAMLARVKTGTQPFDRAFRTKYLPLLTADDLNDPLFAQASVVCSTNAAVDAFTVPLAHQFARSAGTFVVTWDIELSGDGVRNASDRDRAAMCAHNPHLRGYFVRGAPGSIVENLNPGAGFANGSPVRMHSFTFSKSNWAKYGCVIQNLLNAAKVGDTVLLPCEPEFINVVPLTNSTAASRAAWPREFNLVAQQGGGGVDGDDGVVGDEVIVPIKRRKNCDSYKLLPLPDEYPIENNGWVKPHDHGVRLNLSTTYHKVQGCTLDRIILFIDEHDTNFKYASFLVALSRVRKGQHVRVIGMNAADKDPFAAVERMFRKPELFRFFAGYGPDGMFDPDRVRLFDKAVAARSRKSSTDKARTWDTYAFLNPVRDAIKVLDPIEDDFVLNAMVRALRKQAELSTSATARRVANSKTYGKPKPKVATSHATTATEKDAAAQQTFGKAPGAFNLKASVTKAPVKAPTKPAAKPPVKPPANEPAEDSDDDFQAALAADRKQKPETAAQVAAREAQRIAASAAHKAAWRVRIEARIDEERTHLAALADDELRPFERLQVERHPPAARITARQFDTFWALPGVAESLGHLRYTVGGHARLGLFDMPKWKLPGLVTNTCPYDSALVEAHRLLCTNAPLLALLRTVADDGNGNVRARTAARVLLDMHAFASKRMWEAARLVVAHHFLFVTAIYDIEPDFSWLTNGNELNLTTHCDKVDSLFCDAGRGMNDAPIAFLTLETVRTCSKGVACNYGVASQTVCKPLTMALRLAELENPNATFFSRLRASLFGEGIAPQLCNANRRKCVSRVIVYFGCCLPLHVVSLLSLSLPLSSSLSNSISHFISFSPNSLSLTLPSIHLFFSHSVVGQIGPECCDGIATSVKRVVGRLPHLLVIDTCQAVHLRADDIPPAFNLHEHSDGDMRVVKYRLHTLLHHNTNHYTAHGFVSTGAPTGQPYVYFHDAMVRPMVEPAPHYRDHHTQVVRVWYQRVVE